MEPLLVVDAGMEAICSHLGRSAREGDALLSSISLLSLFIQPGFPAHGLLLLLPFRSSRLPSAYLPRKHSHGHPRCAS